MYDSKAVQQKILDSNLFHVFSNVVFGSNDLIKTGTAASLLQDKDKGTLSYNSSFGINTKKHLLGKSATRAWNLGLNAKSPGGIYNIFGNDGWSKEIGLNGGITFILNDGHQGFSTDDCNKLRKKRDTLYTRLLVDYASILREDIVQLGNDLAAIEPLLDYRNLAGATMTKSRFKTLDSTRSSLKERIKKYISIHDQVRVDGGTAPDPVKVKAKVEENLYEFDRANDILSGYGFNWFDFKAGIAYKNINLDATIITDESLKKQLSEKGLVKLSSQLSWNKTKLKNYHSDKRGYLQFFQINGLFERGSFLDIPGMVAKPAIKDASNFTIVNNDNGEIIGTFKDVDKGFWSFVSGLYYGFFAGQGQQMGWDFRANYRFNLTKLESGNLKNSYSILTGPAFRIAGEKDFSKATIGIKAGLVNAPTGTSRLWKDHFTVRLEVGVPFKWYYKDK